MSQFTRKTRKKLQILGKFAFLCFTFISFAFFYGLKESFINLIVSESTKKGGLNLRISFWKRKFKDFETKLSLFH